MRTAQNFDADDSKYWRDILVDLPRHQLGLPPPVVLGVARPVRLFDSNAILEGISETILQEIDRPSRCGNSRCACEDKSAARFSFFTAARNRSAWPNTRRKSVELVRSHPASSDSSHPFEGVFLGVSKPNRSQKSLKLQVFSRRFRFRPGEPITSIAYDSFISIYFTIPAQAIDPSFATSNPNTGSGFDLAPRRQNIANVCVWFCCTRVFQRRGSGGIFGGIRLDIK